MKTTLLNISIILVYTLSFSCSIPTGSKKDPPPLGDLLYGTYLDVHALYKPERDENEFFSASSTDSTYLTLNSDGSYTMRLELYVETIDTTFNILQEGSYKVDQAKYIDSDSILGSDYWKGRIVFRPNGATDWKGVFEIHRSTKNLYFMYNSAFPNGTIIEFPNSNGGLKINAWFRNK